MATGVLTTEYLDDFPSTTRPGSGKQGKQTTDTDIALEALKAEGAPTRVLHLLDYTQAPVYGADGEPTGETEAVDEATARSRASGRVAPLKARGYNIENGWVVLARNGGVYAKYFGEGNVPADFTRKASKPVGEQIPV
jgi:hypothetical protein